MQNGQKQITEFVVKTDNNVGHEMGWDELGTVMIKINSAIKADKVNAVSSLFEIAKKAKNDAMGTEYFEVSLPNMKKILEVNTEGYLVLIAEDKSNIIMPKYFNFMMNKLNEIPQKGK